MNKNYLYILLAFLAVSGDVWSGGGCSKPEVRVVINLEPGRARVVRVEEHREAQVDTETKRKEARKKELKATVEAMPLARILLFTRKTKSADLRKMVRNPEEFGWFKDFLLQKDAENQDALDKMEAESRDKYRGAVYKTSIHAQSQKSRMMNRTHGTVLPSAKSLREKKVLAVIVDGDAESPAQTPAHHGQGTPSHIKNVAHVREGSFVGFSKRARGRLHPPAFYEEEDAMSAAGDAPLSAVYEAPSRAGRSDDEATSKQQHRFQFPSSSGGHESALPGVLDESPESKARTIEEA